MGGSGSGLLLILQKGEIWLEEVGVGLVFGGDEFENQVGDCHNKFKGVGVWVE